jgi:hypothetical protein
VPRRYPAAEPGTAAQGDRIAELGWRSLVPPLAFVPKQTRDAIKRRLHRGWSALHRVPASAAVDGRSYTLAANLVTRFLSLPQGLRAVQARQCQ